MKSEARKLDRIVRSREFAEALGVKPRALRYMEKKKEVPARFEVEGGRKIGFLESEVVAFFKKK